VAPLRLFLATSIFGVSLFMLGISIFTRQYLGRAVELLALVSLTWLVVRLLDVCSDVTVARLGIRGRLGALSVVPLGRRAVKALILAMGLLAALAALGFNLTPALAALGVGGLAVALAAQKTIGNLFGGLTLLADRPVRVGDFCRFGDRIGTVEDIGMRSTRVRTLDRTVVTIPNGDFASLPIENFGHRDRFWFHLTIGLRYETTPDQIRLLLVEIRSMLCAHPRVSPDPARVRFVGLGDSSLNLELFAYVQAADQSDFLEVQEDLLLRIMEIVAAAGSAIAFPSQTLYVRRDPGLGEKEQLDAAATMTR